MRKMILVALLACVSGCDDTLYGEATTEPDGLVYTPDWDGVTAMIGDHCAACHAPGGSADFAPLPDALIADLDAGTGALVVPNDPQGSRLWRMVGDENQGEDLDMPLQGRLATNQVDHVRLWILDGAPYPAVDRDDDGDGVLAEDDCNDADASIFPGATEICDGIDNDCDDEIDEDAGDPYFPDTDGDGLGDDAASSLFCDAPGTPWIPYGGDCDDTDPAIPALADDCRVPVDANCDGIIEAVDADNDGAWACDDCDDTDPAVYPGAPEVCDGVDQDCDTEPDNGAIDLTDWYPDLDGDGHGDGNATPTSACSPPAGAWVTSSDDCDDTNAAIAPSTPEFCNGLDDDCNGTPDDNPVDPTTWYSDADGDGFGDDATAIDACSAPPDTVSVGGDCDDSDTAYNPGANEVDCADPNDYNCDGLVGAVDTDGDGFFACEECDDSNPNISPSALEVCDGVDNNCSGTPDDYATDALMWFPDADGDGYGDDNVAGTLSCGPPFLGWTTAAGDCDDGDSLANPLGVEICDGVDNDCNGVNDDAAIDANVFYGDGDGDGDGAGPPVLDCSTSLAGHATTNGDCDDTDPTVSSLEVELCDGVDNNCSGTIDDDAVDATWFYADDDGDGFGDLLDAGFLDCATTVAGASTNATDCDDADPAVNPNAVEICDGVDNDCDGSVDINSTDALTWFTDADGDGYGDAGSAGTQACTGPPGTVADATDCDDGDATVNPGQIYDFANGVDDDCDGMLDEDGSVPSHAVDIQPIWDQECTGACHGPPFPSSGLDLTNGYPNIVGVPSQDVPTMALIEPGDLANSYLWHKLLGTQLSVGGAGNQMPAISGGPPGGGGGSLGATELGLIEAWILGGAQP